MKVIKLTARQNKIIELVKENQPVTSGTLASMLGLTRAALRADLAILTMSDILQARPKVGYVCSKKNSDNALYDYIIGIKVKDIMSDPVVVTEETTVYDAIVTLFLNDVGTLFIQNNGLLIGAASRKDFLKIAIGNTDIHKVPVGIIMTRMPNIVFIEKEDSAYLAAQRIIDHEVDSLPVIERDFQDTKEVYKIVGKVSKTNITKLFVNLSENE
ncbi:helix-turn-helix transcriptional regulator [Clostridium sp. 19966]|uniref:helix-turn-helix transcriptional regulator n=1 Tax=Clostridium sp. 19966 TaxID=2768166 RepID=UPI0028DF897B|nr:helix-turn-helix transcriptional regulator [Clostridium sp. 19966]MDT8715325.1 helix-turn-helix transcriptional regulator [Clostridium sp. 19966]